MHGELLGYIKNGAPVYDRIQSHIHSEYKKIDNYIRETLSFIDTPEGTFIEYSHDFLKNIGDSICVETTDEDEIIYAQRPHRSGLTRFVKNRFPQPTSFLTIALKRDRKSVREQYILITAYVGEKAPPEPWDKHATSESDIFWKTHALLWDRLPVIENTETSVCPW